MVKHVIMWTLRDMYSGAQEEEIKQEINEHLEGLNQFYGCSAFPKCRYINKLLQERRY